jgi:DNA-directed RNA polymerase specialized sigma24 family protein
VTEKTAAAPPAAGAGERAAGPDAIAEFERLYRANVDAVMAYFAGRSRDPQVVADLTADTFVSVIAAFRTFDPRRGTARARILGIARRVYASHCEAHSQQQHKLERLCEPALPACRTWRVRIRRLRRWRLRARTGLEPAR